VTPLRTSRTDLATALAAGGAWLVLEHGVPKLLRTDDLVGESWGAVAAVLVLGAVAWAVARRRVWPLALLAPLLVGTFDRHTKWALLLAAGTVLLESTQWLRSTGSTVLRPSTTSSVRKRSSEH
jgi:hypothetical protein